MKASIKFFGWQREVTHVESIDMSITQTAKVADALEYVEEQFPSLQIEPRTTLVTVNRQIASLDQALKANDVVSFMPYIGGG